MNRVLVIEEERVIQLLYAEELPAEGYDVMTTCDGVSVMQLIEQANPDLIVLDVKQWNQNQYDLFQEIRGTYPVLPIILCAGPPLN